MDDRLESVDVGRHRGAPWIAHFARRYLVWQGRLQQRLGINYPWAEVVRVPACRRSTGLLQQRLEDARNVWCAVAAHERGPTVERQPERRNPRRRRNGKRGT